MRIIHIHYLIHPKIPILRQSINRKPPSFFDLNTINCEKSIVHIRRKNLCIAR